eukprot:COSAG01_NODE_3570_length_5924_cov_4.911588_5_plen_153_part_00
MCAVDSHVSVMSWVKRHWLPILCGRVVQGSGIIDPCIRWPWCTGSRFPGPIIYHHRCRIWHGGFRLVAGGERLGFDARRQLSELPGEVEVEAARVVPVDGTPTAQATTHAAPSPRALVAAWLSARAPQSLRSSRSIQLRVRVEITGSKNVEL